jgi:hypothetical protein
MNTKTTHGKVCRKMEVTTTQTPVPTTKGRDTLEPTITLNFYVGSVCSEEIIDLETAKDLYNKLSQVFTK